METVGVVLLLMDTALSSMAEARSVTTFSRLMAALLAPTILTLLVIGVARLFKIVRSRRSAALLAVVVLLLVGLGSCGQMGKPSSADFPTDPATRAGQLAAEASAVVPRRVDGETELFAIAAEGATLVYNYRLVSTSTQDVAVAALPTLRAAIVKKSCSTPATRKLLMEGLVLRHVFHAKDKVLITAVEVSEKDCKKGP